MHACAQIHTPYTHTYTHMHIHTHTYTHKYHQICSRIAILKSSITADYNVFNFSHGYSSSVSMLMRNLAGTLAIMTLNVPYNGNL